MLDDLWEMFGGLDFVMGSFFFELELVFEFVF